MARPIPSSTSKSAEYSLIFSLKSKSMYLQRARDSYGCMCFTYDNSCDGADCHRHTLQYDYTIKFCSNGGKPGKVINNNVNIQIQINRVLFLLYGKMSLPKINKKQQITFVKK